MYLSACLSFLLCWQFRQLQTWGLWVGNGVGETRGKPTAIVSELVCINYEKQKWKRSKVFFKIIQWPERTMSKYTSQTLISECSVKVKISFSVNIYSRLNMNSDLMVLIASHLCLPFTIIWVLGVFCYCVKQTSAWNAQKFTRRILHVV